MVIIAIGILAVANRFGDHSWAPFLEGPFIVVPVVYLLVAGSLRYLERGMVHGLALTIFLWMASPLGQRSSVETIAHSMHTGLLWIGAFLVLAQLAYLFFSLETWKAKRQTR